MPDYWVDELPKLIKAHILDLPDTPDQILVVLKAHLVAEQEVNKFLEYELANAKAILKEKPKFHHKLCLLRALIPKPAAPCLWEWLGELNAIRNDLAHKLSPPKDIETQLDKFVVKVLQHQPPKSIKKGKRLRIGLLTLVAYLVFLREYRLNDAWQATIPDPEEEVEGEA